MSSSLPRRQHWHLDRLPVAELIVDSAIECGLVTKELLQAGKPLPACQVEITNYPKGTLEIPKELVIQYPHLRFHSAIGDSLRYHSFGQNPDEPAISVLLAPKLESILPSTGEEGFTDLPSLDPEPLTEKETHKTGTDDGFENLPVLANSVQSHDGPIPLYPRPAHEAEMLKSLGPIIGATLRNIQTNGPIDYVISELSSGIPLLEAFQKAPNSAERLRLLLALIGLAKDAHAKGYALEGASVHDFIVSSNRVFLLNLTALIPMTGASVLPLKSEKSVAPEMIGYLGERTLGGILYGLGHQFMSLASGVLPHGSRSQDNEEPELWLNKLRNPSPELGRLLGSLLAKDPERRLGLYQEIGVDEVWARLEQMVSDWINSSNRPIIRSAGATTIGVYRENNEDAFGTISAIKRGLGHGRHLFLGMVSDGMGGGAVGEIASTLTIESLSRSFSRATEIYPDIGITSLKSLPEGGYTDTGFPVIDNELHAKAMADALIIAHYEVKEAADNGGESCGGMGATAVAIHFSEWNAVIGHVGDSRAYLVRNNTIRQLTTDHSAVQKLVNMGLISSAEAENHSRRHELSQAIGGYEEVIPEIIQLVTMNGDCLLLCTDGVTNVLSQEKLLEYLCQPHEPESIANSILGKVNSLGAPDNATVLIIQVK